MTTLAVTLPGEGTGVSGGVKFEETRGQGRRQGDKGTRGGVTSLVSRDAERTTSAGTQTVLKSRPFGSATARTTAQRLAGLAGRKARAKALRVAPVVITSST